MPSPSSPSRSSSEARSLPFEDVRSRALPKIELPLSRVVEVLFTEAESSLDGEPNLVPQPHFFIASFAVLLSACLSMSFALDLRVDKKLDVELGLDGVALAVVGLGGVTLAVGGLEDTNAGWDFVDNVGDDGRDCVGLGGSKDDFELELSLLCTEGRSEDTSLVPGVDRDRCVASSDGFSISTDRPRSSSSIGRENSSPRTVENQVRLLFDLSVLGIEVLDDLISGAGNDADEDALSSSGEMDTGGIDAEPAGAMAGGSGIPAGSE